MTRLRQLPADGARAAEGKAIAAGARLALAEAGGRAGEHEIELEVLDDTGGGPGEPVAAGANARTAAEDADTIAFIGELDTNATAPRCRSPTWLQIPQLVLGEISPDVADDVDNEVAAGAGRCRRRPGQRARSTLVLEAIERAGGEAATVSWSAMSSRSPRPKPRPRRLDPPGRRPSRRSPGPSAGRSCAASATRR